MSSNNRCEEIALLAAVAGPQVNVAIDRDKAAVAGAVAGVDASLWAW